MTDALELVRALIALPGPPGQENAVRDWLIAHVTGLGYTPETDAKGNLLVTLPSQQEQAAGKTAEGAEAVSEPPAVLVTAHMDEIALMVTRLDDDRWGDVKIRVAPSGGVYTWKWGEGPVSLLTRNGPLPGVLSYGSIHTNHPASTVEHARHHPLPWDDAWVFTGLSRADLRRQGVRPGTPVVLSPDRRAVTTFGDYVASYFLDDRADLAAWLLALETIREQNLTFPFPITFAATVSEEVGGEGAQYILLRRPHDICVALEIGPRTPDADFPIDAQPTIWVRDGYAAMDARDGDLLTDAARDVEQIPHWQYLSRGGSDATCCAAKGLCARPVTLAFAAENSHGYEIMHRDAPTELARLLLAYLKRL